MRTAVLVVTLVLASFDATQTSVATSYLCIPDYATGFSLSNGEWQPTQFKVEGKKYLLANRNGRWFWTGFDAESDDTTLAVREARHGCSSFTKYGFIDCRDWSAAVTFNRKSLRFVEVEPHGYVVSDVAVDTEQPHSTPHMEIGRCSTF
jgi:hypothetical protein